MVEAVPFFQESAILAGSPFVSSRVEMQESLSLALTHTGKQGRIKHMTLFSVHRFLPSTCYVARHPNCFAIPILLVDLESTDETQSLTSARSGICRLLELENGLIRISDKLNVCLV